MSDYNLKSSRRSFLQQLSLTAAVFGVLGSGFKALAAVAAKLVMVPDNDPVALSLGYLSDASKVDNKKWPKHDGADGAKQFCYNCQFYQFDGGDPKSSEAAPCQIFSGRGVTAKGWCNTWTQNPKVK